MNYNLVKGRYFYSYFRESKPFDPILGETFEYVDTDNNLVLIAEQVFYIYYRYQITRQRPLDMCRMINGNILILLCQNQPILSQ